MRLLLTFILIFHSPFFVFTQSSKKTENKEPATTQNTASKDLGSTITTEVASKDDANNTITTKTTTTNPTTAQTPVLANESTTPTLDSFFSATPPTAETPIAALPSPEMPSAWGPFFFLLFVAISLYYGIKYLKKRIHLKNIASSPVDFIKTITTIPVTAQASLAIIEINQKYFIFSVTNHQMNLIQEIEDKSLILQLKTLDSNRGLSKSFREMITSFFQVKVEKKINPNISTQEIQNFVKQQKDKLDRLND